MKEANNKQRISNNWVWACGALGIVLVLFFIGPLVIFEPLASLFSSGPWAEYTKTTLTFNNGEVLRVVIADTPKKQQQGLSGSKSLSDGLGMLFVFDEETPHGIWMKDMNYSIDILWFEEYNDLVLRQNDVSPDTFPEVFGLEVASRFVLETNVGELDQSATSFLFPN